MIRKLNYRKIFSILPFTAILVSCASSDIETDDRRALIYGFDWMTQTYTKVSPSQYDRNFLLKNKPSEIYFSQIQEVFFQYRNCIVTDLSPEDLNIRALVESDILGKVYLDPRGYVFENGIVYRYSNFSDFRTMQRKLTKLRFQELGSGIIGYGKNETITGKCV